MSVVVCTLPNRSPNTRLESRRGASSHASPSIDRAGWGGKVSGGMRASGGPPLSPVRFAARLSRLRPALSGPVSLRWLRITRQIVADGVVARSQARVWHNFCVDGPPIDISIGGLDRIYSRCIDSITSSLSPRRVVCLSDGLTTTHGARHHADIGPPHRSSIHQPTNNHTPINKTGTERVSKPMDAARARSLLAWLAGFDAALAEAWRPLEEEEEEDDDAAVVGALLPLLADGGLLRRAALAGAEPLLASSGEEGEDEDDEEVSG